MAYQTKPAESSARELLVLAVRRLVLHPPWTSAPNKSKASTAQGTGRIQADTTSAGTEFEQKKLNKFVAAAEQIG